MVPEVLVDLVVPEILVDLEVLEVLVDLVVPEILVDLVAWFLDNLWVLNRLERQHLLQLERLAPQ
mgnify:CR=1 FL=1